MDASFGQLILVQIATVFGRNSDFIIGITPSLLQSRITRVTSQVKRRVTVLCVFLYYFLQRHDRFVILFLYYKISLIRKILKTM